MRDIVILCTGRGRHKPIELAVLTPVEPRADLAHAAEVAGIEPPAPTPAAVRGYGVRGSLTTVEPGHEYTERKSEARIVDKHDGATLVLPVCPHCWRRPGRLPKDSRGRREARPDGARIAVERVATSAARDGVLVGGRIEVNVANLR